MRRRDSETRITPANQDMRPVGELQRRPRALLDDQHTARRGRDRVAVTSDQERAATDGDSAAVGSSRSRYRLSTISARATASSFRSPPLRVRPGDRELGEPRKLF